MGPEQEPTCGEAACDSESSSSSILDIPKSQERLSSSALNALSSAAKLSSSSQELPISAGIPHSSPSAVSPSSSSATPLSSSVEEPIALSGDIAPFEDPVSSSSEVNSSNSRPEIEIITVEPDPDTTKHNKNIDIIRCDGTDSTSYDVRLCKDPHGFTILSMVTTFELDDIQA